MRRQRPGRPKMLTLRIAAIATAALCLTTCQASNYGLDSSRSLAPSLAPGAPPNSLAGKLNSWIGKPLDDFLRSVNSVPARDVPQTDGGRLIIFDDSYDDVVSVPIARQQTVAPRCDGPEIFAGMGDPSGVIGLLNVTPPCGPSLTLNAGTDYIPQRVRRQCYRAFLSDSFGILIRWRQLGDGC